MIIRKKCSEPRDTVLTIRLSRSEHNRLKQMASELGISVAKLLLGIAFGDINSVGHQNEELFQGKGAPGENRKVCPVQQPERKTQRRRS